MRSPPSIYFARSHEFTAAQRFYESCGYGGSPITDTDVVVLARREHAIVGVGRLCTENGFLCLRGMQVHAHWRGAGIGSSILTKLTDAMGADPCFCLPYGHLVQFYGQAGFGLIGSNDLPETLAQRLTHYLDRGLDVVAMLRPAMSEPAKL